MPKFYRLALKMAYMCSTNRHRVGCIVARGGKIISMSHNHKIRHAEERACSVPWASELEGATVYVVRPLYDAQMGYWAPAKINLGCARPCPKCMEILKANKIKKVVYSIEGGWAWERI
jgi:pyrimidine deaminase RibD-like protein